MPPSNQRTLAWAKLSLLTWSHFLNQWSLFSASSAQKASASSSERLYISSYCSMLEIQAVLLELGRYVEDLLVKGFVCHHFLRFSRFKDNNNRLPGFPGGECART